MEGTDNIEIKEEVQALQEDNEMKVETSKTKRGLKVESKPKQ